jgi:UDP-N-acetylmuramoylalanine--D-glutamate ligase
MAKYWDGQRVLIIGAARQGLALARYLINQGAQVVINDQQPAGSAGMKAAQSALSSSMVRWVLGGHPFDALDGIDLVCISGGVPLNLPLIVEAQRRGLPLSNDSQIFMEAVPCPTIGITGSAGKTTTTTLVGRIAGQAPSGRRRIWVGGNIGNPLINSLEEMRKGDLVVMELSSFQLEIMTHSPHIAAVLNLTPNHLDRHETMEAYRAAKSRILEFQDDRDVAVLNREDPGAWSLLPLVHGRLVTFGLRKPEPGLEGSYLDGDRLVYTDGEEIVELMPVNAVSLRGRHNLLNVLAAGAIACAAGLPATAVRQGVEGFAGVPHRLEFVRTLRGAHWYNDSIATAPERAIAAMQSFQEPLVLLAGGRDKKLPWENFARLVHERVDHLILFGEAADLISAALGQLQPGERPYSLNRCSCLQEAVQAAAEVTQPGDVVLLAPGGTSFDEFRDFEERGERYKRWVMELS